MEDFDLFIRQFENLIENKAEDRRDDRQERAVQELIKLANGVNIFVMQYDAFTQQLNKERQT